MKTRRPDEHVYFLKPVGMEGPIKIGWSIAPPKRLLEFAVWSPFPLELIGSVPGGFEDEQYLHQCFFDLHSHREWFFATTLLKSTVAKIIVAGTVDCVRSTLFPSGSIRKKVRQPRSAEWRAWWSYACKVRNGTRKLSVRTSEEAIIYSEPSDIEIMLRQIERDKRLPTAAEIARLDDFLANITTQSVEHRYPCINRKVAA
jgi:hypothetical protein